MNIHSFHFFSLDSTNTWSKNNAPSFPHDSITLVTANEQTAGRGRVGRQWLSPPNQNLHATYTFFMQNSRCDWGNIPQIMALSAAKLLEEFGFSPQLKWPNDLLVSGKKIGGILTETTDIEELRCIILGIGLNVNMSIEELNTINRPVTSLFAESGQKFPIKDVLKRLNSAFQQDLALFLEQGFAPFYEAYLSKLIHRPGDPIRFQDHISIHEGKFHSISGDGALNLKLPSGEIKCYVAGEIN